MTMQPADVPVEIVEIAVPAWVACDGAPADKLIAALAAVLPAHERMVRARITTVREVCRPSDPDARALYERLRLALTCVIADDTEADIREAVARALTSEARCFVEGAHQRHTWSRDGIGLVCPGEPTTSGGDQ